MAAKGRLRNGARLRSAGKIAAFSQGQKVF